MINPNHDIPPSPSPLSSKLLVNPIWHYSNHVHNCFGSPKNCTYKTIRFQRPFHWSDIWHLTQPTHLPTHPVPGPEVYFWKLNAGTFSCPFYSIWAGKNSAHVSHYTAWTFTLFKLDWTCSVWPSCSQVWHCVHYTQINGDREIRAAETKG